MSAVRFGIIGVGLVGKRHVAAIGSSNAIEVAGVVEPSEDGRQFSSQQGLQTYPSVSELLEKASPDGVIIATPTLLHVEQALECIEHKVPVLIEKPIATNSSDAAQIVDAAEQSSVPVLVGHHRRHNPIISKAHQLIRDGFLGDIRAVQGTCWFYKPDTYFEVAPWRKKKGAGPISVNLVHDIDLIRHLVGEIVAVQAQAAPSVRGFENEDVAAAVLRFANGAVGTISVSDSIAAPWSWEHTSKEYPVYPATPENCYMIGGSKGSMSIPDLRVWSHDGKEPDWWTPISASSQIRGSSDPLINQVQHFAEVIKGNAEPLVSGREGLLTLRVIEAIEQSAATGNTIELQG